MKTLKRLMALMMICYVSLNTLSAQTSFQVTLASTDPGCGLQDGSIQTTVTGGTGPFTFEWYDTHGLLAFTTQNISGLGVGHYTVQVTDATFHQMWQTVDLTNGITATITTTDETCASGNGTATLVLSGGTAPYAILWEDGQTGFTATGLSQGYIEVNAVDVNGCVADHTDSLGASIFNNSPVTVESISTPSDCGIANGTATVLPYGGVTPYTYYWNTTPVQTGATATNLLEGAYTVRVTDATGCAGRGNVYVGSSSGTLQATASVGNETCGDATGQIAISATGGTAPYSYLWQDASTAAALTGLSRGWYNVIISDNGGCVMTKYLFVDNNTPVSLSLATTPAACDRTGGAVTAIPAGGASPYTYDWGWSHVSNAASITNVADGYYTVLVTDANGCEARSWAYVPQDPSCMNVISGKMFQDDNGNCVQDAGEYPLVTQYVQTNIGSMYGYVTYTNGQGQYSVTALPGNYNVYPASVNANYNTVCPVGSQYLIDGTVGQQTFSNKDFALQPIAAKQDLEVYAYAVGARPGFQYTYVVFLQNKGTSPASGSVTFQHDASGSFLTASPAADTYSSSTRELSFSYSNLGIGEIKYMYVYMQLPVATTLGTILNADATATLAGTDDDLSNNTYHIQSTVTGSFDPNDIAVSPEGVGSPGYILRQDEELTYHIRFQNTGTAEAYFIRVVDTLDTDINPTTLHDIVASHPYVLTVRENRILDFYFPDINLPDSTTDLEGSNGFITYKVNQANMLPMGSEITNKAFIYFDYNLPVETNTVLNTITTTAPVVDPTAAAARHKAYPVPAHDQLVIQSDVNYESVQVMDLTGRVVKSSTTGGNTFEINVNDLAPGVYIYKIFVNGEAPMTGKVVVE